jgi:integrase
MTKLTLRALQRLANEPGRHPDGVGLFLRVKDADHRFWTYRYRLGGKETELSLGPYPKVGLDEARRLHAKARAEVVNGIDPRAGKKLARDAKAAQDAHTPASAKPTFGAMADLYIDTHEASWRNPKHRQQWSSTLRDYCAPIRSVPVDQIDTQAILGCLRPIWTLKPETASRVRGRIETILNAARALGFTDENRANPARWRGHLDQLLPKQPALSRGNHAALPYGEVPAFMARLKDAPGAAAKALAFLILTAARSGEILGVRWDELDEAGAVWTVPAHRMKAGKAHRVPLSVPALAILAEMRAARRNDHPFVFPGQRPRKPLSNMALEMTMRRLGAGEFTPHGMRSGFRDWATEVERVEYATAERCLAHAVGSDAALAYDRSDRLELRRPVMTRWAQFVLPPPSDNVIELRRTGA